MENVTSRILLDSTVYTAKGSIAQAHYAAIKSTIK